MIVIPAITPHEAAALFAAVLSLAVGLRALRRTLGRISRARWARGKPDMDALRSMSPNDFERYAAAAFEARGWRVEIVGREGKPDGGLDLLLTANGRRVVVQCKRYAAKVGASVIREAVGVMLHHKARGAYVVGLSGFTKPAHEWAKGKPIKLVDGTHLLRALDLRKF